MINDNDHIFPKKAEGNWEDTTAREHILSCMINVSILSVPPKGITYDTRITLELNHKLIKLFDG